VHGLFERLGLNALRGALPLPVVTLAAVATVVPVFVRVPALGLPRRRGVRRCPAGAEDDPQQRARVDLDVGRVSAYPRLDLLPSLAIYERLGLIWEAGSGSPK
jgi:hypothetical protein